MESISPSQPGNAGGADQELLVHVWRTGRPRWLGVQLAVALEIVR
jgi:hypothetical protein